MIIADDMGLGKTVQALAVASVYRSKWPLVIVCPSSVRFTWKEAVVRWIPSLPEEDIRVLTSGKDRWETASLVILSYDLLPRKESEFAGQGIRVAILDESHFIKNNKANRTKSAARIFKRTEHLILLSGTPALSRPMELFQQLTLVQPRIFQYPVPFGMRYCNGRKVTIGRQTHYDFQGSSNMEELRLLMEET